MPPKADFRIVCYICREQTATLRTDGGDRDVLPDGCTSELFDEKSNRIVYCCPDCTASLDEVPNNPKSINDVSRVKLSDIALTEKQYKVLEIIFEIDQQREEREKLRFFRWMDGEKARSAKEWRWICYGVSGNQATWQLQNIPVSNQIEIFGKNEAWITDGSRELKTMLEREKLDNQGLGRIFTTLAAKELIKHEMKLVKIGRSALEMPFVQLTRRGRLYMRRKLSATLSKESKSKFLPEWKWQILDRLADAGGVFYSVNKKGEIDEIFGEYGGVRWKIWLQLKFFRQGALVEQFQPDSKSKCALRFTEFGKKFYQEHRKYGKQN